MVIHRLRDSLNYRLGVSFTNPKNSFFNIRRDILCSYRFDLIVDVGANRGQWLDQIKPFVGTTPVFAFEPLKAPFEELERKFSGSSVKPYRLAIGEDERVSKMFVASNGAQSSSLSAPTSHLTLHPEIYFELEELVEVVTLDHFLEKEKIVGNSIYLKVDVQGAERSVMQGAKSTLERVSVIEIESCMTPEYENEVSHHKLISLLLDRNFIYFTGEPPRVDSTGRQWDLNSILCKKSVLDTFRR